jgi:hypothetical protein
LAPTIGAGILAQKEGFDSMTAIGLNRASASTSAPRSWSTEPRTRLRSGRPPRAVTRTHC